MRLLQVSMANFHMFTCLWLFSYSDVNYYE